MTAVQVLAISLVLDIQLGATARGQIGEQVASIMSGMNIAATGKTPLEVRRELTAGLEHSLGLDLPLPLRAVTRTARILVLDFGETSVTQAFAYRRTTSVRTAILEALPNTLLLFGIAALLSATAGLALGLAKTRWAASRLDRGTTLAAMTLEGTPSWWIGTIVVMVFVYTLRIFPFGSIQSSPPPEGDWARLMDRAAHFVLPVASVFLTRVWGLSLLARSVMLPQYHEDFVMSARGRGIPEWRILGGHTLRSAAPGLVATVLQRLLLALSGDIVLEIVFAFPGIGFLLWGALRGNDINLAAGILACLACISSLSLAALDLLHSSLDPRIGAGSAPAST